MRKQGKCRRKCCVENRKYIGELQGALSNTAATLRMTERKLSTAREDAFMAFMDNSGKIERATYQLTERLAELLGKELMPHAQKILNHATEDGRIPFDIVCGQAYSDKKCTILSAEIKPLRFNVALDFLA